MMKKASNILKKITVVTMIAAVLLILCFMAGRYGWKLFGFTACESAGIESVEVSANEVKITGFYPGSFPRGFLGYHAEEENGILYVGFKFSGLFGIFETGDFGITIPVKGEISEVIIKTKNDEYSVWPGFGSTEDLPTDRKDYVQMQLVPVAESVESSQITPENAAEIIYEGEYASCDTDEPMLYIQKTEDRTYSIQIGIYRLIQLDKCVGIDKGDRLEFSTVELGENQEITGTIVLNDEAATVTLYAPWSDTWFKDVNEFDYYKLGAGK